VQAGGIRGDRAWLQAIVDEQMSVCGRLKVNTALAVMDVLAEHIDGLRRRLLSTARGMKGARALMHDIYGVGPLSSLALCAWLGGADSAPGRLSRQGPEVLRWLLSKPRKPPPDSAHPATTTSPSSALS
jgi:transposase